MSDGLNVVQFPERDLGDVPRTLRKLADNIEAGEYGDAHNVAWVVNEGNSKVSVGMAGHSALPGAEAHYLLSLGMRKLEIT